MEKVSEIRSSKAETVFSEAELTLIRDVFTSGKVSFTPHVHKEIHGIMTKLEFLLKPEGPQDA